MEPVDVGDDAKTPAASASIKPVSRASAKRLRALHTVHLHQMNDSQQRAIVDTSQELQETRQKLSAAEQKLRQSDQKLSNMLALLEAVVRRNGAQTFDRKGLESTCARGDVAFDVSEERIVVRLRDRPKGVDVLTGE